MSWIQRDPVIGDDDKSMLDFCQAESLVLCLRKPQPNAIGPGIKQSNHEDYQYLSKKYLKTSSEWKAWCEKASSELSKGSLSGMNLIIGAKGIELSELPFNEDTFDQVAREWNIHSSIVRAINRNTSPHFGCFPYDWDDCYGKSRSLVYNCRTSDTWESDMALSMTYFPETLTTKAVWYGCDATVKDVHGWSFSDVGILTGRLESFDGEILHPMILPTLFAEFERERLVGLTRENIAELVRRINSLSSSDSSSETASRVTSNIPLTSSPTPALKAPSWSSTDSERTKVNEQLNDSGKEPKSQTEANPRNARNIRYQPTAVVWLRLSGLRNGLESWRAQLVKMIDHTKDLDASGYLVSNPESETNQEVLCALKSVGQRILGRLNELLLECDEATRDCTRAMEGMNLSNQLETNILGKEDSLMNRQISENGVQLARSAQRDAETMKLIAVLGMIFLPGMFTSSFFSIGFFEYQQDQHLSALHYILIWLLVTLFATLMTALIFPFAAARRQRKAEMERLESIV